MERIISAVVAVGALLVSTAAYAGPNEPLWPANRPILVQERREEFRERRERCEHLRVEIDRDEHALREERREGDRREAHEIHESLERLRHEYFEHHCDEVLERR